MVLRGRMHLGTCTHTPSVNNVMAGTGCPKVGPYSSTNKGQLNGVSQNGGSPSTSVETQAVSSHVSCTEDVTIPKKLNVYT